LGGAEGAGEARKESKELAVRSIPPYTITTRRPNGGGNGFAQPFQAPEFDHRFRAPKVNRFSRLRRSEGDILIPPRQASAPSHEVVKTATEYLVRVFFPGTVSLADLRWELVGDVLEVEYTASGWYYYENFLVPVTSAPKVSIRDHVFEAQFPKVA